MSLTTEFNPSIMASNLQDEHAKYEQFVEELNKLTKGSSNEASSAALEHGRALIDTYSKDLTVGGLVSSISTWRPDTPEEIETLEMCLKVSIYPAHKEAYICLYSHRADGL
jgi:hypothetical protein